MKEFKKLLIIDDDPISLHLLVKRLEKESYHIVEALDSHSGYKMAISDRPDLILLDVMLPGKDGYNLCRSLKSDDRTRQIPVIFLTAKADTTDKIRGLELGAADYIVKPFDPAEVLARVRTQLRIKGYQDQLREKNEQLTTLSQVLVEINAKLRRLTETDPLTGIWNRRAFERRLEAEHKRSSRYQHPYSVAIGDVDHFKAYNDTYGHPAGDEVLCQVASRLSKACRLPDLVCRYGGEEFAFLLPETTTTSAKILFERVERSIWEANIPHEKNPGLGRLTLSFGFSGFFPERNISAAHCLGEADQALYEAKERGGNCVVGFPELRVAKHADRSLQEIQRG